MNDELREFAADAETFNNEPGHGQGTQVQVREDVRRSVLDGARRFQDQSNKAGARTSGRYRGSLAFNKPLESMAAGCHSNQVKAFNEMYKSHGIIGAYHKPDGTCVFESNHARNAVLAVRGLYDRDAGYRQYTGVAKD